MLIVTLVRLTARWVAWAGKWAAGKKPPWPPEMVDLDRRASKAMTMCSCGHIWHRHERPHTSTSCSDCACARFRPAERPRAGGAAAGG